MASLGLDHAIKMAKANLDYIMRPSAAVHDEYYYVMARTEGKTFGALETADDKKFMIKICHDALKKRARKHRRRKGKSKGVSLCHKIVVSLPLDANPCHQMVMAESILEVLAGDSEAVVLASIHFDTPNNPHLHLWIVDGPETIEAAQKRAEDRKHKKSKTSTKKTRVRRRDQLRLTELNGFKKTRLEIANAIDEISLDAGLRRPEIRSLKEQGLDRKAPSA